MRAVGVRGSGVAGLRRGKSRSLEIERRRSGMHGWTNVGVEGCSPRALTTTTSPLTGPRIMSLSAQFSSKAWHRTYAVGWQGETN